MTDVNILKYLLFTNEKNELMDICHLVYTRNSLALGMLGSFRGNLLMV